MLSHGKLDLILLFMAGPKSANLQHTSGPKLPRKIIIRVLEKYVRLVALTSTSPKVDVAASKLVPRKEKIGSYGFKMIAKNNFSFLGVRLVITVSIRIILCVCVFLCFFFLYSGYGVEC